MITEIFNDNNVSTKGCGCCSDILNLEDDREEILTHLEENLMLTKGVLQMLDLPLSYLLDKLDDRGWEI